MKYKNILVVLFSIVFLSSFVLAATAAPTDVIFNNNFSAHWDEGTFFVNWTAGVPEVDPVVNYSIYAIVGGVAVQKQWNNSVLGFNYSSATEEILLLLLRQLMPQETELTLVHLRI